MMIHALTLLLLATYITATACALRQAASPQLASCTRTCTRSRPHLCANLATLKASLVATLADVPNRGLDEEDWKQAPYVEAVDGLCTALGPLDPSRGDWMVDAAFSGSWRLLYTSSRSFRGNGGFCGYATYISGVSTPELRLHLLPAVGSLPRTKLTFEEPLSPESAALVARDLRLADEEPPDSVRVECVWAAARDDSLQITAKRIVVGSRSWAPTVAEGSDVDFERDKATRVLGCTRPVFLDAELLVLRALTGAVFVFGAM